MAGGGRGKAVATILGEIDYRKSALERLQESELALGENLFAGGVYLAGRAVEGVLRALIWRYDRDVQLGMKSLDTGHNRRELLDRVLDLGVLGSEKEHAALA